MQNTKLLLILDGWGYSQNSENNAIAMANTPNWNHLIDTYPNTLIGTSGESVGLPKGQMGNSEVGHLTIGAGRIVEQDFTRIGNDIKSGTFFSNKNLCKALDSAKANNKAVHILGLLSDGGVHSHISHLKEILYTLSPIKKNLFIHAFTDGRDVDPKSGINFINQIEEYTKKTGGSLPLFFSDILSHNGTDSLISYPASDEKINPK